MTKILVFEDNQLLAQSLTRELEARGLTVVHYSTPGPDPVTRVLQVQPACISLDVNMPGMNGFEAAQRLKADPRTQHIPLVFYSTMGLEEDRQLGLSLGAAAYFHKLSVSPDQFAEWLERQCKKTSGRASFRVYRS